MIDRIFLRLNDKFALGCDDLQWILYKKHGAAEPMLDRPNDWRPVSFVRSTKDILLRCMREKGCTPLREAQVALESYPATFDAWKALTCPSIQRLHEPVKEASPISSPPEEPTSNRGLQMSSAARDYEEQHRNCDCHTGPPGHRYFVGLEE